MIPEPYYINLGRGLQAVHRFFLGNGDKNVSRETYQLTMDNGQLTICPGTGNVSLGRAEKIKQCGPPGADRGDILIMGCIYRSIQKQTVKKLQGAEEWTAWKCPPQLGRLDVHHLRTLNANTCNKAAGTLRGRGVSSLK